MRRGEEPRSRADTGKEQSLTFQIAHDLGIGERSTRVDRKFPVGMRRWWRDDSRFCGIGTDVNKIGLRVSRKGRKQ